MADELQRIMYSSGIVLFFHIWHQANSVMTDGATSIPCNIILKGPFINWARDNDNEDFQKPRFFFFVFPILYDFSPT